MGCGKADAEHGQALEVSPSAAHARPKQPPHHNAKRARVEFLEVNGVERHGPLLTLLAFKKVRSRLLPVPFQSPLRGCYGPGRPCTDGESARRDGLKCHNV